MEQNHFCNFCRGHFEEQFFEFISNLGQWLRRRYHFKESFSGALAALLFSKAEPLMQFLKESIMRNIHVKFYEIRACRLKIFIIWSSGGPLLQWSWTICAVLQSVSRKTIPWNYFKFFKIFLISSSGCPFVQKSEGILRNKSVNLFRIWASGSGGDFV